MYKMPQKSTVQPTQCFSNKPVERKAEELHPINFKFHRGYREIVMLVNATGVVHYVELSSLLECVLVSDVVMIGIIKTLYGDRVVEKCGKSVITFDCLHEICDAIIGRKVDTRAKNRAKSINTLTDKCYMLHVNTFPIDKIKASITNTSKCIENANAVDEQAVCALVRNLIQDLTKLIGD